MKAPPAAPEAPKPTTITASNKPVPDKNKIVEKKEKPKEKDHTEYYVQAVDKSSGYRWAWSHRRFRDLSPAKNHMALANKQNTEPGNIYYRVIAEDVYIHRYVAFEYTKD